jgi:hypothetical protein
MTTVTAELKVLPIRFFLKPMSFKVMFDARYSVLVNYTSMRLPGVNRLGRGADHSPPSSAEVEYDYIYTSASPQCLFCM